LLVPKLILLLIGNSFGLFSLFDIDVDSGRILFSALVVKTTVALIVVVAFGGVV
jgi:hypothetical protein